MVEKNNATCKICGKPYYVCMSCKDTMKLHPWKTFTDTAEHYKVFQAVRGFSTGVYTKNETKEKFKNIDIKDIESFRPHIKDIIKDILKDDYSVTKTIEEVKPVEVEIVNTEDNTEDNMAVENIEKEETFSKSNVFRKKHYK